MEISTMSHESSSSGYAIWPAAKNPADKLCTLAEVVGIGHYLRLVHMSLVATCGCYDLLHLGHVGSLRAMRRYGDHLMVFCAADDVVRRAKGPTRPMIPLGERVEMLAALACVDWIVVQEDDTPHRLLELIRPDVLAKGGDYRLDQVVGREVVESYGGRVAVTPCLSGYSTTLLLARIHHVLMREAATMPGGRSPENQNLK